MKVTVCFGPTRVIVPCGNGEMLIKDLADAAVRRYKKATSKVPGSWVLVHSLKSLTDGGILDPDDQLLAVCDDKEQILAIYDEQDPIPAGLQQVGDGSSSVGTSSPDWAMLPRGSARGNRPKIAAKPVIKDSTPQPPTAPSLLGRADENSVEITNLDAPPSSGLLVLNRDGQSNNSSPVNSTERNSKKQKRQAPQPPKLKSIASVSSNDDQMDNNGHFDSSSPPNTNDCLRNDMGKFVRAGPRQSTLADKWLDAAEKAEERYWTLEHERQEPVGQERSREPSPPTGTQTLVITLTGQVGKPLGIQVAPDYGNNGKLCGIVVTQIHEEGRAFGDQRIEIDDVITEINGRPIYQMSFVRAQKYLHEVSQQGSVSLQIVRRGEESHEKMKDVASTSGASGPMTGVPKQSALQKANTKKMGQKLTIDLKKGDAGLGFTVTSRDMALDSERPFYIKNILPRGAAIEDGRLKAGDRLLEVNGKHVAGMSQPDVVSLLRQFRNGDTVSLLISRQQEISSDSRTGTPSSGETQNAKQIVSSPNLPRQLPAERANADELGSERNKQLHNLDIALNDTGSAGLGVSVKGRTVEENGTLKDCGIYIKSIMHGGAAFKDGRLRVNDHLIAINSSQLEGCTNNQAMKLIGETMQNLPPDSRGITLQVLRVINNFPSTAASPDEGESMYLDLERVRHCTTPSTPQRYTVVPGYGDYAMVVKSPSVTLTADSINREKPIIVDETNRELELADTSLYDEVASLGPVEPESAQDTFKREAMGRRSMSEKRHGVSGKGDPSHTLTFQRIKHSRQTSAPVLQGDGSTVTEDLNKHQTTSSKTVTISDLKESFDNAPGQRRSMSLESIGQIGNSNSLTKTEKQQPMIHELAVRGLETKTSDSKKKKSGPAIKKVQRSRPQNDSFRQAVDRSYLTETDVDIIEENSSNVNPSAHYHSLPRPTKEKERRKSTGSGLFSKNWFRIGSGRSRETSPNKPVVVNDNEHEAREKAKLAAQEEQKRIREQYERLKVQQQQEVQKQRQRRISSPQPKLPSHWQPSSSPASQFQSKQRSMSSVTNGMPPPYPQRSRNESEPPPPYFQATRQTRQHAEQSHRNGAYRFPLQRACPAMYYSQPKRNTENGDSSAPWFVMATETTRFYRSLDRSAHSPTDHPKASATVGPSTPGGSAANRPIRRHDVPAPSRPPMAPGTSQNSEKSTNPPSSSSDIDYERYLRPHRRSPAVRTQPVPFPPSVAAKRSQSRPQSNFVDYQRVSPQGQETVYDYPMYDSYQRARVTVTGGSGTHQERK